MTQHWQNLAALALVLAAGAYLARHLWLTLARKKAGGCGSCSTCPTGSGVNQEELATNGKPLVSIDALEKSARKD